MAAATLANGVLLRRFSMQAICFTALLRHCGWSSLALAVEFASGGICLVWFVIYTTVTLFALGLNFGNINAMALQSFGHIAGAAAVQAPVMTLVSLITAAGICNLFDGTLVPVLVGYLTMGLAALALIGARAPMPRV